MSDIVAGPFPAAAAYAVLRSAIALLLCCASAHAQGVRQPGVDAQAETSALSAGPARFELELIGNFSRLPAFVGVRDSEDLAAKRRDPGYTEKLGRLLRAKYPYAHRARVGNLFFGYSCAGMSFREIATRDASGAIHYDFDEVIGMLDMVVAAGFKPLLALTGTPAALVPAGERPVRHPVYGCVNGPAIDWSKSSAPDRARDWWNLQHAFFDALVRHFGIAELKQWEFATWTEPYNPSRAPDAHLVYTTSSVPADRFDEAVATILAASIDAAMKAGLPIHIGNFAGDLNGYPKVMSAIGRLEHGQDYLSYITGFAVSRYRTQPKMEIGAMVRQVIALEDDPRMPKKPLFVDEIGELVDDTGTSPPRGMPGLESASFIGQALHEAFVSQVASHPGIRRMAIWEATIGTREAAAMSDPRLVLPSAMQNTISMYSRLNGLAVMDVRGGAVPVLAGKTQRGIYLVASSPEGGRLCDREAEIPMRTKITGLRAGAQYEVVTGKVDRVQGNPISAFLGDRPSYLCDTRQIAKDQRRWTFANADAEHCFYEDSRACSWRENAASRTSPAEERGRLAADAHGTLTIRAEMAPGSTVSVELTEVSR